MQDRMAHTKVFVTIVAKHWLKRDKRIKDVAWGGGGGGFTSCNSRLKTVKQLCVQFPRQS